MTYVVQAGAISSGGTVTAHAQGSDESAANFTTLGTAVFNDAAGGTVTASVDLPPTLASYRYYRSLITVTGGTVSGAAAVFIGQPRTG